MPHRVALVASTTGATKHYHGLPPELTGGRDGRVELPGASFLVLSGAPGGFYLFRYTEAGTLVGDTWHEDEADALEQVAFEFTLASAWIDVPAGDEPVAFAQRIVSRPRTASG